MTAAVPETVTGMESVPWQVVPYVMEHLLEEQNWAWEHSVEHLLAEQRTAVPLDGLVLLHGSAALGRA